MCPNSSGTRVGSPSDSLIERASGPRSGLGLTSVPGFDPRRPIQEQPFNSSCHSRGGVVARFCFGALMTSAGPQVGRIRTCLVHTATGFLYTGLLDLELRSGADTLRVRIPAKTTRFGAQDRPNGSTVSRESAPDNTGRTTAARTPHREEMAALSRLEEPQAQQRPRPAAGRHWPRL